MRISDWSSDVCSSDLYKNFDLNLEFQGVYGNEIIRTWNQNQFATYNFLEDRLGRWNGVGTSNWEPILDEGRANNRQFSTSFIRSEERRVGKECVSTCRSRW